jgi:hypothetical protein|tara:strand:- start:2548 stop:2889 length:342 start_codon:yes stop_codon:yes gene_type:complete
MTDKKLNDLEDLENLPGFKRGNPTYFENEVIDHLISITLELGAELWVIKDRLAHVEEILSEENKLTLDALDTGKPSALLQEKLDEERKKIIKRIYGRLYSKYGGEEVEEQSAI